ncbi:hypothetical protein PIB30_046699 [Stylosanthes scabra]|uniref:Uncharacterized protein n=1 Tax=Stylosanthes scabra TaxID=79078 RepID=A0ABU6VIR7_9FABA|nr:hypothetical protein [Stylosanthes scabra]
MTTNLSECINTVLKGTRFLPISAIVRATYERLQQLWIRKGQEAHAQVVGGSQWSQHAVASCAAVGIEWGPYVDPVYSMESVFSVYSKDFPPIPDERLWPACEGKMQKLALTVSSGVMPVASGAARWRSDSPGSATGLRCLWSLCRLGWICRALVQLRPRRGRCAVPIE